MQNFIVYIGSYGLHYNVHACPQTCRRTHFFTFGGGSCQTNSGKFHSFIKRKKEEWLFCPNKTLVQFFVHVCVLYNTRLCIIIDNIIETCNSYMSMVYLSQRLKNHIIFLDHSVGKGNCSRC